MADRFHAISTAGVLAAILAATTPFALSPDKELTQFNRTTWDDELPQNSVRAILQTGDGYMWFGTYEGLARFDGVRFTNFDRSVTGDLPGTAVYDLVEDSSGDLWIATNGGLAHLCDGVFSAYTSEDGLISDLIYAVLPTSDGRLWLGTDRGLVVLADGVFSEVLDNGGAAIIEARDLAEDSEGNLWVATEHGLFLHRDGRTRRFGSSDGLPDERCWVLHPSRDGSLWIGTDGGLAHFQDGRFTSLTPRDGLPDPFVRAISEDREGNLWVGTEDSGLSRISKGRVSTMGEDDGLSQNHVRSIYEDLEGNLWVGTNGGLNQLREGKVTTFTTQEGLSHDFTRAVLEDRKGALWIGTDGGGLNRLYQGRIDKFTVRDGLSSNSVRSLHEDRSGALWIGTRSGLDHFDGSSFTSYSTRNGLSSDLIRAILQDLLGDIWIATENGGVNRLRNGEVTVFTTEHGLANNRPRALFEDRFGTLWIGTYDGASQMRDGTFVTIRREDGLSNNIVFAFAEDSRGNLWIGTDGGLNLYRNGKIVSFTTEDGLSDNTIFRILEDDHGHLWTSSNKGISRISLDELYARADGRIDRVSAAAFNKADGMKANQCNGVSQPAGCKTAAGELWFPTVKGVVRVNPADLGINTTPPAVLIEMVTVDGKQVDPERVSVLAPGERSLELHYTALSFVATERMRFRYRLVGFDPEWIDAGTRRTAYYTNIPPGEYRFWVAACNSDGVWNEIGSEWTFEVPTPLHRSWWAFLLYTAAAIAVISAAVRWRLRNLGRLNLVLETRVVERTAELARSKAEVEDKNLILADKIDQLEVSERRALESERIALEASRAKTMFLSNMSHELRTPLNSIIGFANILTRKLDGQADERSVRFLGNILASGEHLLGLINDLLDLAKIEEGRMEFYPEDLDLGATMEGVENVMRGVAAEKGISIEVDIPGDMPLITGDPGKIKQVMFNLISNAIKFSPHDSEVRVRSSMTSAEDSPLDAESVRLDVIDRGIGIHEEDIDLIFEVFRQADGSTSRRYEGSGLGVALVRRLVEMHRGTVQVRSTKDVGSTFTVFLPLRPAVVTEA